jgi:uncharacterized protein (TIGR02246 family)
MRTGFSTAAAAALAIQMTGPLHADDVSEIEAAQSRWEEAFASADGAKVATELFTEDARLLPEGSPMVVGRDAVAKFFQEGFDAGVRGLELGLIAVEMVGDDTMIETGTATVTVPGEDGKETRANLKALVVWKKEADGVWRMDQDMWNSDE